MRMKLYTLLCISFFLLFTACNQDDDPVPPEKVSRTVLAYIMADNSLSNYASLDIDEMMVGMAAVDASDNNLLVYVGTFIKYYKISQLIYTQDVVS